MAILDEVDALTYVERPDPLRGKRRVAQVNRVFAQRMLDELGLGRFEKLPEPSGFVRLVDGADPVSLYNRVGQMEVHRP